MNEENFEKGARREHAAENASREGYWQNERNKQNDYSSWGNNHYNRGSRPRFTNNRERVGSSGYGNNDYTARNYDNGYKPRGFRQPEQGGSRNFEGRKPRFGSSRPNYNNDERGFRPRPYENRNIGQGRSFRPRFNAAPGYAGNPSRPESQDYNRQEESPRRNYGYNNTYKPHYGRRPGYDPNAKYNLKKRREYKEENFDPNQPIRLNKYLSNAGICSRRDADKYIEAGVVTVNGEVVTELGRKVLRSDEVKFHDKPVKIEKKVYVLLNKPKGYVTTSEDPQNRKTVMDLVRGACPERIYPVGRLDRNTTGVLLLTNDGELASKLTHPQFMKKKIYHVFCDKNVTAADLRQIAEGITLDDGEIRADAIEYASPTDKKQVGIEIHSGRNRIVRRIFESLGYHVIKLDRVYFAGLTKKNVQRGDWRYLTEKEVNMLRMGAFE